MTSTVREQGERSPAPRARSGLAALPRTQRNAVLGVLALIGAVPFLVAVAGLLDGWRALGDNAIIGIRIRNLLDGDLPLVGLPSTGENFGSGVASSHPGPLGLYVLSPFVLLFGPHAGLALGAAAVNSAAFVVSAWAAFRRGGVFLAALTGVFLCILARALGPYVLIDPISSNLGTFPSIAFALVTWAVLAGDRRLLPVAVVVGTFTIQAHLTYLAIGGAVAAVLAVGLVLQEVRGTGEPVPRRVLATSGILGLVLWAPVVLDQLFGSGNVSSIVRTFSSGDAPGRGFGFAVGRVGYAIGAPPLFGHAAPGLDFLDAAPALGVLVGIVVVLVLVVAAFVPIRGRLIDPSLRAYVAVVAALVAVSVYSAMQLPDPATVKAANLRWMWTAGLLIWLGATWALTRAGLRSRRVRASGLVPVVVGVVVLATLAVVLEARQRPARDAQAVAAAEELAAVAGDAPVATYRVTYAGGPALLTVGPGFAYDLSAGGSTVLIDAGPFTRAYGDAASYRDQQVEGTFLVAAGKPGEVSLPAGYEEQARTSYPESVGSASSIDVVLGYRSGQPVADADAVDQPAGAPAYCADIVRLQGVFASLGQATGETRGAVADALAELDLAQLAVTGLPPELAAAVDAFAAQRDDLVSLLREQPDADLEGFDAEFAARFPDLVPAIQQLFASAEVCT